MISKNVDTFEQNLVVNRKHCFFLRVKGLAYGVSSATAGVLSAFVATPAEVDQKS